MAEGCCENANTSRGIAVMSSSAVTELSRLGLLPTVQQQRPHCSVYNLLFVKLQTSSRCVVCAMSTENTSLLFIMLWGHVVNMPQPKQEIRRADAGKQPQAV